VRMVTLGAAAMLGPLELASAEPELFWSACFRFKHSFSLLAAAAEAVHPGSSKVWDLSAVLNGLNQGAKLSMSMSYDWRKVEETLVDSAAVSEKTSEDLRKRLAVYGAILAVQISVIRGDTISKGKSLQLVRDEEEAGTPVHEVLNSWCKMQAAERAGLTGEVLEHTKKFNELMAKYGPDFEASKVTPVTWPGHCAREKGLTTGTHHSPGTPALSSHNADMLVGKLKRCTRCRKVEQCPNQFRKCKGCARATYCSVECQKMDWSNGHKPVCHLNPLGAFIAVVFPADALVRPYEVVVPCPAGDFSRATNWIGENLLGCENERELVISPVERGARAVACLLCMAFRRPGGQGAQTALGGLPNTRAISLISVLPGCTPLGGSTVVEDACSQFMEVGPNEPKVKVRGDAVVLRQLGTVDENVYRIRQPPVLVDFTKNDYETNYGIFTTFLLASAAGVAPTSAVGAFFANSKEGSNASDKFIKDFRDFSETRRTITPKEVCRISP